MTRMYSYTVMSGLLKRFLNELYELDCSKTVKILNIFPSSNTEVIIIIETHSDGYFGLKNKVEQLELQCSAWR